MLTIRMEGERRNAGPGSAAEPVHHEGHRCPNRNCGGEQTWCRDGIPFTQHTHQCPRCGCVWQHGPGGR